MCALITSSISSPQLVAGYALFSQAGKPRSCKFFRLTNNQSDSGVYLFGDGEGAMIRHMRARPGAVESPEAS